MVTLMAIGSFHRSNPHLNPFFSSTRRDPAFRLSQGAIPTSVPPSLWAGAARFCPDPLAMSVEQLPRAEDSELLNLSL